MLSFLTGLLLAAVLGLCLALYRTRGESDEREEQREGAVHDRQRALDFMHLMAEALGEGLSLQELHQRIVHASILCTGALSACIFEKTPGNMMRSVAVEGLFPPHRPLPDHVKGKLSTRAKFIEQVLRSEEFPLGEGIAGRVAQTGRGELIADAVLDPRIVKHDDPSLAVRSVIAVPMTFRDRFFGVLVVANPVDNRLFTEMECTLMQSLAEQAALALHNAEMLNLQIERKQLDIDLSIASGIQKMLLPAQSTTFAGLDIDARYAPAQRVGGDLFDLLILSPTRLAVAVADVSGKGIAASLYMAVCRTNLRQIAPRHISPAQTLSELNRAMGADIHGELYVTVLLGVIDTAANTVTFARAGHEQPLFARRDPATGNFLARLVPSEGMPVGLVPDDIFESAIEDKVEHFGPGDMLVLYTDGVTEAPNEEEKEFSSARLCDVVRAIHEKSSREINDGILESVRRFTGEEAHRDDLTLVTVKRT
ncbi:MAG TPA: GAF domain-containing SpoIIE family protein phosphatase [Opitutaceae bacterium]|jgi:sigma-B regulation protein RsbU (phosphoserine phosphatase)